MRPDEASKGKSRLLESVRYRIATNGVRRRPETVKNKYLSMGYLINTES
jgi:hypothetical protein